MPSPEQLAAAQTAAARSAKEQGRVGQRTEVRKIARGLIDDPAYQEKLKERLLAGKLHPAVESLLWRYAYGNPDTEDQQDRDLERFDRLRESVMKRLREPEAAKFDAAVQGAKRVLTLPMRVVPALQPGTVQAEVQVEDGDDVG